LTAFERYCIILVVSTAIHPAEKEEAMAGIRNHVRTTVVLPAALDQNLGILSAREGKAKNTLVIEALDAMLRKEGLQPLKKPMKVTFDVKY
jgi:hypothetical protein